METIGLAASLLFFGLMSMYIGIRIGFCAGVSQGVDKTARILLEAAEASGADPEKFMVAFQKATDKARSEV
jgi:hypothetical protein